MYYNNLKESQVKSTSAIILCKREIKKKKKEKPYVELQQ